MKALLKKWLPPIMQNYLQRIRRPQNNFCGDYKNWADAMGHCQGYNDPLILDKVLTATLKVKRGDAAFERDSIAFNAPEYHWPIIAALMSAAATNGGRLHVMDFGGSLGSKYFQHIELLKTLDVLTWNIVEQANYVSCGREKIQDDTLRFYNSVTESESQAVSNVILLSSVLQYIEEPEQLIAQLSNTKASLLIIDKTPMTELNDHQLVIQCVPTQIYKASYPTWLFSRRKLLNTLEKHWKLVVNTPRSDKCLTSDTNTQFYFDGMILSRR